MEEKEERIVYHYSRGSTDPVMGLAASEEGEIPDCCKELMPSIAVLGRPGDFYEGDELGSLDMPPTKCNCGKHIVRGSSISGRDLATGAKAGDIYITETSPGF